MEKEELKARIEKLLAERSVLTLSTVDEEGLWAAPVFFAAEGFDIYFVSSPDSRHGKAIAGNSQVAAAIHSPSEGWQEIRGLQIEGDVALLSNEKEIERARKLYIGKFPFTEIFFSQESKLEPELREKVSSIRFYRFRPRRIVLTDNAIRFGFRAELQL